MYGMIHVNIYAYICMIWCIFVANVLEHVFTYYVCFTHVNYCVVMNELA